MCVCAGTTGAAVLPVAHHVQAALKTRTSMHRSIRHHPTPAITAPRALAAVSCAPAVSVSVAAIGMSSPVSPDLDQPSMTTAGELANTGAGFGGGYGSGNGAAPVGFEGPGGGGGGLSFGGGMRPQIGGGAALGPIPATSPAPEVATWAMMVTGIGVTGGTLRYRRRQPSAV